ncbi:hemolysin family protein [Saccharibacillus alkalitolerans]|uniref:HlyC/CorC family transporter n=1 Tax=Saccharibacillus alkalitolerans TaxID=2705290 RepID=A0ABX0FCJ1_9BACL|nr:hemolysin family protein [Saccharibacillus alkalitolerans]NGZ77036.1 HlyC/CorC family transporter [Saccharibacillus alkalitolerans]
MDLMTIVNLLILAVLLALTAFFVASEFAVVKVRASRLDQLITEGNKKAVVAKKVAGDLDYYLSACQLGITVTALGLGAIGKPAVELLLYPVFDWLNVSDAASSVASYAIAFFLVTFLHVVVGEMAPKTLAIQFAEKLTLLLASPLYWFGRIMYPFIWALNGAARVLLRAFGVKPAGHEEVYSEDELKIIMTQSYEGGEINETKLSYMENVFSFDERVARDIMVPRTQLVTLDKDMDYAELIAVLDENNYTRYPVTEENNKDRIIGVVNAKKMLPHVIAGRARRLEEFIRRIPIVSEATPIQEAMLKMQQERMHIALVVDEYGGTAGIVTMEDVMEELVGEIRDEFDADEIAEIRQTGEREYVISGRVLLDELEKRFGVKFDERSDTDTIGGWLQHRQGTAVGEGAKLVENGHVWTITEKDDLQIKRVRLNYTEQ